MSDSGKLISSMYVSFPFYGVNKEGFDFTITEDTFPDYNNIQHIIKMRVVQLNVNYLTVPLDGNGFNSISVKGISTRNYKNIEKNNKGLQITLIKDGLNLPNTPFYSIDTLPKHVTFSFDSIDSVSVEEFPFTASLIIEFSYYHV
jgi:hypothetical protein